MRIANGTTEEQRMQFLIDNRDAIIEKVKDILYTQNNNELIQGMEILLQCVVNNFYDYTTMQGLSIEDTLEKIAEDFNPSVVHDSAVVDAQEYYAQQSKKLMGLLY